MEFQMTEEEWSLINKAELMLTKVRKQKGTKMTKERRMFRDLVKTCILLNNGDVAKATNEIETQLKAHAVDISPVIILKEVKSYLKNQRDTKARKSKKTKNIAIQAIKSIDGHLFFEGYLKEEKEDGKKLVILTKITNLGQLIKPTWRKGLSVLVDNNYNLT
ncbi:uncharacterized protein LOC141910306 [Tubulanus polymorphus]|uniref:uncharacterized protein LOC141910306 n=1 Tax=Tubulanus polymorphus TaxID=672921 RepID=UPI003DA45256